MAEVYEGWLSAQQRGFRMQPITSDQPRGRTICLSRPERERVARRRIDPNALYLISRYGSYFKPGAHGYTRDLSEVGLFTGDDAAGYLCVEGLSIVPTWYAIAQVVADIDGHQEAITRLRESLWKMAQPPENPND